VGLAASAFPFIFIYLSGENMSDVNKEQEAVCNLDDYLNSRIFHESQWAAACAGATIEFGKPSLIYRRPSAR